VSLFLKIQLAPELLLSISLLGVINDGLLLGENFLSSQHFPFLAHLTQRQPWAILVSDFVLKLQTE
jgi:hypothetical protein